MEDSFQSLVVKTQKSPPHKKSQAYQWIFVDLSIIQQDHPYNALSEKDYRALSSMLQINQIILASSQQHDHSRLYIGLRRRYPPRAGSRYLTSRRALRNRLHGKTRKKKLGRIPRRLNSPSPGSSLPPLGRILAGLRVDVHEDVQSPQDLHKEPERGGQGQAPARHAVNIVDMRPTVN